MHVPGNLGHENPILTPQPSSLALVASGLPGDARLPDRPSSDSGPPRKGRPADLRLEASVVAVKPRKLSSIHSRGDGGLAVAAPTLSVPFGRNGDEGERKVGN